MKTPGNGPGCPSGDPGDPTTTRTSDCSNPSTFVIAWSAETNVYEQLGGARDLDIFITRTTDAGETYEPYQVLAGTESPNFDEIDEMESQIRPTPDGRTVFAVWNEVSEETGANSRFAIAVETEIPVEPEPDGGVPDGGTPPEPDGGTDTTWTTSGCSASAVEPDASAPMWLALLGALLWLHRGRRGARRFRRRSSGPTTSWNGRGNGEERSGSHVDVQTR